MFQTFSLSLSLSPFLPIQIDILSYPKFMTFVNQNLITMNSFQQKSSCLLMQTKSAVILICLFIVYHFPFYDFALLKFKSRSSCSLLACPQSSYVVFFYVGPP